MRKRPEIPEDVFFDDTPADEEPHEAKPLKRQKAKTTKGQAGRKRPEDAEPPAPPPAEDEAKSPVTLYLTRPVLHRLEEARFLLLTEHGVKTSKSAIANYALTAALHSLQEAADALREE